MHILRRILKETKNLPKPVADKIKYNLKRVAKSGFADNEAAEAALRLITFLSRKGRDDSALFKHFKSK